MFPRLISRITKTKIQPTATSSLSTSVKENILPSLGASGAIYSAVVVTALAYPHSEIALIFPPTPPIPIQWGVGALIALDCVGVIRGWRYGWAVLLSFFLDRFFADADAQVGCLTIMPTWGEPRSELFTTLTGLKSGTFSGLSTRCLTDRRPLNRHHDPPPVVEDETDSPAGIRCCGRKRTRSGGPPLSVSCPSLPMAR